MKQTYMFDQCSENLQCRAATRSLRTIAVELGYPRSKATMLWHVLSGGPKHAEHVSERSLRDLSERLGLKRKFRQRKHVSVSVEDYERANVRRQAAGMTWGEWLKR